MAPDEFFFSLPFLVKFSVVFSPVEIDFPDEMPQGRIRALKAAKQLRRGKRISEIEMLYGKTAANAAVASNPDHPDHVDEGSRSPKGKERLEVLPELTKEFFESPFFSRFHDGPK
jgi:hypothetical protein